MRDSIRRFESNYRLLSDCFFPQFLLMEEGLHLRIGVRQAGIQISIEMVDWGLSQWHGIFECFTGPVLNLLEVRLVSEQEKRLAAFQRFFKVPVLGGRPHNELVYHRDTIDLPNYRQTIEPGMDTLLRTILKEAFDRLPTDSSFKEAAFIAIQQQMIHTLPTLENIAPRLNTSTRTLQRRLKAHGLTFKQLLDEARKYLAEYYLRQSSLNITEIGLLLGFADHPTLTKAFRRWFGMSPREFRRIIADTPSFSTATPAG